MSAFLAKTKTTDSNLRAQTIKLLCVKDYRTKKDVPLYKHQILKEFL